MRSFTFAVVFSIWLSPQVLKGQPGDQSAVNLLAQKLHGAYGLKDQEGVLALWSPKSPQLAEQRGALQKLFAGDSGARLSEATVGDPEITGVHARVRIDREIAAVPGNTAGGGKKKLVLECVKESDEWKIWREIPAAQDLAERLAGAGTEEAQSRLLASNPDLIDSELATALIDRGRDIRNRGDFSQALGVYNLAYAVAEGANAGPARALALNNAGLVHYDQGDFSQALETYRRSLALSEELHDDENMARTLNNMGAVYSDSGEFASAWESFEKSLALGQKLHQNRLISNAMGNMAIIYGQRGDYLQAFSLFNKVYEMDIPAGNKRALAIDMLNLANVFMWQGDYAQSQDYYQRALEMSTAAGMKALMAIALMSLGRLAEFRGGYSDAIGTYQKSLAIFQEIGDKPYAATDLSYIGSAYSAQGDHVKGLEFYQKAVDLQKEMGGPELALTLSRMATTYNLKGDFREGARVAAQAADASASFGMREAVWRAYLEQGNAERGLGKAPSAEKDYRRAIDTIEALRIDVAGDETERANFFEDKLRAYHSMIDLLVAGGRPEEAFNYAERAKARVLLDVFKNGRMELTNLMTDADRRKEQEFRLKLASLNARLVRERKSLAREQLAAISAELDRTRLDYDEFETGLYAQHPDWKLQTGAIEPVKLDEVAEMIPEADTAFAEFVVTEDRLYTFVSGGATPAASRPVKVLTAQVSRAQLVERVEQFRKQLANRDLGFRASAAGLYRLLFGATGADVARKRHLVIVPDGVLWELPFQALVDPAGRYLLDDAAVSFAHRAEGHDASEKRAQSRSGKKAVAGDGQPRLGSGRSRARQGRLSG